jgi:DNA repair exonuclease SbcCD nuclease subunit
MPTRFLHTADWQLGKPYERIDNDDDKRSLASQARFDVLNTIGERIKAHRAEFVLVAGDLFDSIKPSNANVSKAFERMGRWNVPVFIIPGNHDHGGPGSLWENDYLVAEQRKLAPLVQVLLERKPVVHGDVVIYPCPLLRRTDTADLTAWLRDPSVHPAEHLSKTRIVLAHGTVQGFGSSADEEEDAPGEANLIDVKRLPAGEYDYIALGDWHGTTEITPKAWYAGTPETDRFPKGADNDPGNILEVVAGRGLAPEVTKTRTSYLNWVSLEHRFTTDEQVSELESKLLKETLAKADQTLIKLHLTGSLGIKASGDLQKLYAVIRARSIRLKLKDEVGIAPTDEEIGKLCQDSQNPLIARVAAKLVELAKGNSTESAKAALALRELFSAV